MSRHASGLKAWVLQRVSAIYLALFLIYLLFYFLVYPPASYEVFKGWILSTPVLIGLLLFINLLLLHAWIGIRDVAIDYLWHTGTRVVVLTLVGLMLSGCGLWSLVILISAKMS
jgi:succinate dehydrogenase / fumarate reductase membrane anchor subunit